MNWILAVNVLCLCAAFVPASFGQGQKERQGKFYRDEFLERVLNRFKDITTDVIGRVTDNLELAMDQLTGDVADGIEQDDTDENVNDEVPYTTDEDFMEPEIGKENFHVPYINTDFPLPTHDFIWRNIFKPVGDIFPNINTYDGIYPKEHWYKGPNVCVDEEETDITKDENEEHSMGPINPINLFGFGLVKYSKCLSQTRHTYVCEQSVTEKGITKKLKLTYRCCHGFERAARGCTYVNLTSLAETLDSVGAKSFNTLLKSEGLEALNEDRNLTLFVPTDEAMEDFLDDYLERNNSDSEGLKSTLLTHATDGFVFASDFGNEGVIASENEKSVLRIHSHDTLPPVITVNCAKILRANIHSENSVAHTVDRVIQPATRNIADIIENEDRFSKFAALLKRENVLEDIRQSDHLTAFVPTNDAFESMHEETIRWLLEDSPCIQHILEGHFVPKTICSVAIPNRMNVDTINDMNLPIELDDEGRMIVGKSNVTEKDIVAVNGVIHVIDEVLIRREDKNAIELLKLQDKNKFLEAVEKSGIIDELKKPGITVFAPDNKAVEELMAELKDEPEKLKATLKHHILPSFMPSSAFINNKVSNTSANTTIRMSLYTKAPLLSSILQLSNSLPLGAHIGCEKIQFADSLGCNAVVHGISNVLNPTVNTVIKYLEKSGEYSIFLQMIKDAGMEKELEMAGPFTVLAPSDHVFKSLPVEELQILQNDKTLMKELIDQHIISDFTCCSAIRSFSWVFTDFKQTLNNGRIHLRRLSNGKLMAGKMRIIKCGNPTVNGIVHGVNRLNIDVASLTREQAVYPKHAHKQMHQLFEFL